MSQTPSVGRVVHYVAYGTPGGESPAGAHRAAIITQIDNIGLSQQYIDHPEVSLCVLNPNGMYFAQCVSYSEQMDEPGSWHWPEHVP